MNKTLLKIIILGSSVLSFNTFAEPLSQTEISNLFSAKTAGCIKTKDKSICQTYMGDDGSVKRFTENTGKTRLGTGHASANNQLCIRWEGKSKDLCFDINKN